MRVQYKYWGYFLIKSMQIEGSTEIIGMQNSGILSLQQIKCLHKKN